MLNRGSFRFFLLIGFVLNVGLLCSAVPLAGPANPSNRNYKVCTSEACKDVGSNLHLFDSEYVCNDFYKFVCATYNNKHKEAKKRGDQLAVADARTNSLLEDILSREDRPDDMASLKAAREYHRECMDKGKIEENSTFWLRALLRRLGGWPLTNFYVSENAMPWRELDRKISQLTGKPAFYDFSVVEREGKYVLKLAPPKLTIPPKDLLAEDIAKRDMYYKLVRSAVLAVEYKKNPSSSYIKELDAKIRAAYNFEMELAKIITDEGTKSWRLNENEGFYSVREFQQIYDGKLNLTVIGDTKYFGACLLLIARKSIPSGYHSTETQQCKHKIDWFDEMKHVFGVQGTDIFTKHTTIFVENVNYFIRLCRLFEATPELARTNFIVWNMVKNLLPYTTTDLKTLANSMTNSLNVGRTEDPDRWKQCLAENTFIDSVYYETLRQYFPSSVDDKVLDLLTAIELEVTTGFKKWANVTAEREKLAEDKLNNKIFRFKAPERYMHKENFDVVPVKPVKATYLDQVMAHMRYSAYKYVLKLGQDVPRDSDMNMWSSVIRTNVDRMLFEPLKFEIPAGSMQVPFFDETLPDAYVYGTLGTKFAELLSEVVNRRDIPKDRRTKYLPLSELEKDVTKIVQPLSNGTLLQALPLLTLGGFLYVTNLSDGRRFGKALYAYGNSTIKVDYYNKDDMAVIEEEKRRIDCYRNQTFGKYESDDVWVPLTFDMPDFRWTHKIQDALGLDVAYKALVKRMRVRGDQKLRLPGLEGYNSKQLFFIAYANAHCNDGLADSMKDPEHTIPWMRTRNYTNADKVNMAIMNHADFPELFNCPRRSALNPEKCTYWDEYARPFDAAAATSYGYSYDASKVLSKRQSNLKRFRPILSVVNKAQPRSNVTDVEIAKLMKFMDAEKHLYNSTQDLSSKNYSELEEFLAAERKNAQFVENQSKSE